MQHELKLLDCNYSRICKSLTCIHTHRHTEYKHTGQREVSKGARIPINKAKCIVKMQFVRSQTLITNKEDGLQNPLKLNQKGMQAYE
jgi:hypothetical protein